MSSDLSFANMRYALGLIAGTDDRDPPNWARELAASTLRTIASRKEPEMPDVVKQLEDTPSGHGKIDWIVARRAIREITRLRAALAAKARL